MPDEEKIVPEVADVGGMTADATQADAQAAPATGVAAEGGVAEERAEPDATTTDANPASVQTPMPVVPAVNASATSQDVPAAPASLQPSQTPATPVPPHFGHYSVKEAQALSSKARTSRIHHETDKILAYVSAHGSVSKDEAARFLHVAGSTAYRYLSFLVKEGKLKREGRGRAVRYVP